MAVMTKKTIVTFAKLDDPDSESPRQEVFFNAIRREYLKEAILDGLCDAAGVREETDTTSIRTRYWLNETSAQAYLSAIATIAPNHADIITVISSAMEDNT